MSAASLECEASQSEPIRVLIADDSRAMRTLVRSALSPEHGFQLAEAVDGGEAVTLSEKDRPDCVVLDIEMPGMDGWETLAELRLRHPALPVVMLSGCIDLATVDRARESGAAAFLKKSEALGRIAEAIREVTTGSRDSAGTEGDAPPSYEEAASDVPLSEATSQTSDAEMRRLEYVLSHDLAEPLRIVNGFSTLLESRHSDVLDASARSFLTHIVAASARLEAMIDDLVVYSRAARREPQVAAFPLTDLVEAVCESLRALFTSSGARVSVGDLPTVVADGDMVGTVVRHLIVNAITFNASEAPRVHISATAKARSTVLSVSDNGIGIAPNHHERVFDLFRRLHTRDEYPGTGTGLALCRRIVERHGGTIALTSSPGIGTTVTVTLPSSRPRPSDQTTEEARHDPNRTLV